MIISGGREISITGEAEKKRKYSTACSDRRASFTPLCFSVDGLLGCEADVFLKQLANRLFDTWDRSRDEPILPAKFLEK